MGIARLLRTGLSLKKELPYTPGDSNFDPTFRCCDHGNATVCQILIKIIENWQNRIFFQTIFVY